MDANVTVMMLNSNIFAIKNCYFFNIYKNNKFTDSSPYHQLSIPKNFLQQSSTILLQNLTQCIQ